MANARGFLRLLEEEPDIGGKAHAPLLMRIRKKAGSIMNKGHSHDCCKIEAEIICGFWAIENVSVYLNVKVKTLYLLVSSGDIPHYRIGRLIRFKKDEIDSWMEQKRIVKKDPSDQVKKAFRSLKRSSRDINMLVKKTIDQINTQGYTTDHGKPDHIKDLRKEVRYGDI